MNAPEVRDAGLNLEHLCLHASIDQATTAYKGDETEHLLLMACVELIIWTTPFMDTLND